MLPLSLSILASIVVVIASILYNLSLYSFRLALNNMDILILAVITFSTTLLSAWIGIKFLDRTKYTPSLSAVFGILWGSVTFFLIAIITVFSLTPSTREFWRAFEFTFMTGFFLGGFLGPLIGGIIGYRLAKQYSE